MTKLKNNKNTLFCGHFFYKGDSFIKILAKYNCSGPPSILMSKIQRRILFHHCQHANIIHSICSIHQIICKSPMIYKATLIFNHAHPIIIKVTFSFPKFVSACKKSAEFINPFLKYSRF